MIGNYTFFTPEVISEFWNDCHVFLKTVAPEIEILIAMYAFYRVALMLKKMFFPEPDDEDKFYQQYDEEEY